MSVSQFPLFLFSPVGYCTVLILYTVYCIIIKWERDVMCARARAVTFALRAQKLDIRSSYNSQDGRR